MREPFGAQLTKPEDVAMARRLRAVVGVGDRCDRPFGQNPSAAA
jgi:hypothetical protein